MIKSWKVVVIVNAITFFTALQTTANAQLFGNQNIGSSPGNQLRSPFGGSGQGNRTAPQAFGAAPGQAAPGQAGTPGPTMLDGNERFVRGNRSRQDFVGTGRNDLTGFVGAGQAIGVGRVPAATESFRLEATSAARVNKPLPKQPSKGMYYPRLVLDLESSVSELKSPSAALSASPKLQRRVMNAGGADVQIVVTGSTAVLTGFVNSQRAAELVVNVLSFEPGIESVDNRLTVK